MKTRTQTLLTALALLAALELQPSTAHAQGTAFAYQGRLNDGTNAANGIYDLRFALYDSVSAGTQQGGLITNSATAVGNGLFSVTLDFGNQFPGGARWLEIAVRTNGAGAFTTLSPRQPLPAVPYAITAGNVTGPINGGAIVGGTITSAQLAAGAVTAAIIASNSITSGQLASGAAAANLNAQSQSAVPSGGMVLSSNYNDGNLLNAGYVKLGRVDLNGDSWDQFAGGIPLEGRFGHRAVWTGSEMIVWGGDGNNGRLNDGGRYNPAANNWALVTTNGAPVGRENFTTVWTGSEMIIWGGDNLGGDGARYNPVADSWTAVTTNGAPSARQRHSAVWTGSEMIIWGGFGTSTWLNDGGRYNPMANSWIPMTTAGAPFPRSLQTAVWTGNEMIVWGGNNNYLTIGDLNDGGRYNPANDSWTAVNINGSPTARQAHTAVWTGSEMIVWGGFNYNNFIYLNDGGRYNPTANTWTAVTTNGAPTVRYSHTAIWTGNEMIIWGGANGSYSFNDGARFNPVANSWTAVTTNSAPGPRSSHTAAWTGSEMIVWGGDGSGGLWNDGGRYNPAANSWIAVTLATNGAPVEREGHTAVWTGSEMIVWGGSGVGGLLNDGGRYNPAANSWVAVTANGAPIARQGYTAVWTGSEMIIWGGFNYPNGSVINDLNDGGRYNPAVGSWTAVTTNGAPIGRDYHTAVWTGSEMIVWGGVNYNSFIYLNDGSRYNPVTNGWTAVTTNGAPTARYSHIAIWTGNEMIIWGGGGARGDVNDGGRYNPAADAWMAVTTNGAPIARAVPTAVWTGNEMIVWGGDYAGGVTLNDGGRYNPVADTWAAVATNGAPIDREIHTAVWTGNEMIVWGGRSYIYGFLNDGGRYNPSSDSWIPITSIGAPSKRTGHTAVWTGSEMIVWGGRYADYLNDGGIYHLTRTLYLYQRQ